MIDELGFASDQKPLHHPPHHTPLSLPGPDSQSSRKKQNRQDRFIPSRICTNLYNLFKDEKPSELPERDKADKSQNYSNFLQKRMFGGEGNVTSGKKILRFNQEKENCGMGSNMTFQHPESSDKKKRSIQKQPYKVLEVPQLKDDFYLNLIDWSQNNHVAVGLQSSLYVWSGCSSRVQKIYSSEDYSDYICSVAFGKNNPYLAFGNTSGEVQLFDLNKNKQHTMFSNVHAGRIGSLGCTPNLISTGGRDGIITIQDYRTRTEVTSYKAHQQEICGLKWSPDFQMIASGGNDNKLVLYSLRMMNKMATFSEHKAAVKALSFDPNAPIIASGGGTADRHIRFFSTQSLTEVYSIDTGSQVCNLMFSPISRELVTTHGYSLNQINLWKVGDNCVEKLQTLTGHNCRVLYLAGEQEGGRICTGAGDQTLRFWNIFEEKRTAERFDLR